MLWIIEVRLVIHFSKLVVTRLVAILKAGLGCEGTCLRTKWSSLRNSFAVSLPVVIYMYKYNLILVKIIIVTYQFPKGESGNYEQWLVWLLPVELKEKKTKFISHDLERTGKRSIKKMNCYLAHRKKISDGFFNHFSSHQHVFISCLISACFNCFKHSFVDWLKGSN